MVSASQRLSLLSPFRHSGRGSSGADRHSAPDARAGEYVVNSACILPAYSLRTLFVQLLGPTLVEATLEGGRDKAEWTSRYASSKYAIK